ncbi:hypothetical protein MY1884_009091 [Beauveria asiatica]
MPSLLHVLTEPNVKVDSSLVAPGSNTTVNTYFVAEDWVPWPEFSYSTITHIFQAELAENYQGSPSPLPLKEDLRVVNEDVFDGLLQRFEIPVVNYALHWLGGQCHYGKGSRCGTAYKPDWSLVCPRSLDEDGWYTNLVPGDTKLHAKWRPEMRDDGEDVHYVEWQKVVAQITNYMAYHGSRYGFVITEANLVVFRLTRRPIDAGIATSRSRRLNQSHVRYPSDVTMGSSDGSFVDDNPLTWAYYYPQYVTIPWSASGRQLTVKLALWALAMMAAHGGNSLEYSYPGLDTWCRTTNGYVHNASGTEKAKLGKKDKLQDGVPTGEASGSRTVARDNTGQVGDRHHVNLPVRPAADAFNTERIKVFVKPTIDNKGNVASFKHKEHRYMVEMDKWIKEDEDTRTITVNGIIFVWRSKKK